MGSQPATYEQTPQSCFTLHVGCDWIGRGDWTTLTYLKTLLHIKTSISFDLKTAQKIISCTKLSLFRSSEIHRFLVAHFGEVISFLRFLCLFVLPVKIKNSFQLARERELVSKENSLWICRSISTILGNFPLESEPILLCKHLLMDFSTSLWHSHLHKAVF